MVEQLVYGGVALFDLLHAEISTLPDLEVFEVTDLQLAGAAVVAEGVLAHFELDLGVLVELVTERLHAVDQSLASTHFDKDFLGVLALAVLVYVGGVAELDTLGS